MEELIYYSPSLIGALNYGPKQKFGPLHVEEVPVSGVQLVRLLDPDLSGEQIPCATSHPASIGLGA